MLSLNLFDAQKTNQPLNRQSCWKVPIARGVQSALFLRSVAYAGFTLTALADAVELPPAEFSHEVCEKSGLILTGD